TSSHIGEPVGAAQLRMGLHKQDSVIAADGENGFGPARTYDRPERVGTGTRGPVLHDTQLHQHPGSVTDQAEPVSPISRSHVTHHPEPMCHASGGTKQPAESWRSDSNRRPSDYKSLALPGCATPASRRS